MMMELYDFTVGSGVQYFDCFSLVCFTLPLTGTPFYLENSSFLPPFFPNPPLNEKGNIYQLRNVKGKQMVFQSFFPLK